MSSVTLSVSSLHANISYKEGIKACEKALSLRESLVCSTTDFCQLIWFILLIDSFCSNSNFYLQIQDLDIGTCMFPLHTNFLMGSYHNSSYKPKRRNPEFCGGILPISSPYVPMANHPYVPFSIAWAVITPLLSLLPLVSWTRYLSRHESV